MRIQLRQIADSSICLEIPIQSDIDGVMLWKKRIVTDILLLAYLNKPATFITISPDENSVGCEFPNEKVVHNKKSFLINCVSTCNNIDLIKLGESYDVELGLLSVTSLTCKATQTYNLTKLFPKDENDHLSIKEQLFYCSNDGYKIYWLNFERPFEEVLISVQERMSFYKIEVIV